MIVNKKLVSIAILFFAGFAQCNPKEGKPSKPNGVEPFENSNNSSTVKDPNRTRAYHQPKTQKYSSRIVGSRYPLTDSVYGIRTFPVNKSNLFNENGKKKEKVFSTTENVLDFRIENPAKKINAGKAKTKDIDGETKNKDMATAFAGGGKQKDAEDEEEKTLAQQVADGKYGLIQNEIFANGSKRPGIISYSSNTDVPKDTKDNLGGLEKDEIWLAEDHILVLRGGNYQEVNENETPSPLVWPPIDDFQAANRQVKIPKNPEIPPPFPVQLTEDGPVEFIKGQGKVPPVRPIIPPLPPFGQEFNKTPPFPFPMPNPPSGNQTLPYFIPPHLLPPFLNNLPPGATFVAPPDNQTEFDEDDPSIYYPPRYDFYYPQDNTTAVPPGPLVPGIILPPPPDFFSLLENDTHSSHDYQNETDESINSVTPNTFQGPKYLPNVRKPTRPRISPNRYLKRPITVTNISDINAISESPPKPEKPTVSYVYPENFKQKQYTTTTTSSYRANAKISSHKPLNNFKSPIFVLNNVNQSVYHPLPTTSPKPNHITLPTTKTLPKQIFIVTTPETVDKNRIEEIYKKPKLVDPHKYERINPEIHPLRTLIKPNVTISYNGKYGHLPPATAFLMTSSEEDGQTTRSHYVTQPPVTKASKTPSTDINSITVTPIPVVKKIRIHPVPAEKPEFVTPPSNPSKATFYFYEEPLTTKTPAPVQVAEEPKDPPVQIPTLAPIKSEVKPVMQYYYTTKSTGKTPIRQFLEETFHSSNVLPRKPQIAHLNNAEIITHNSYPEIPKMKHLNYGTPVSSKPAIKYHYVTEDNTVIIPGPKIKDLEIKNSGSSGLQNVNLDKVPVRPKPIVVQESFEPAPKPEAQNPGTLTYVTTPKPVEYQNTDGPFVPSNYYATARPEHIHFTSQEQTLVDDITKNYFTIFGQKINSVSTTPLTPVKPTIVKATNKPESGLTYISDNGHNFKIQQVHDSAAKKPAKSSAVFYTNEKPNTPAPTRPPSNFEKYLKELTGEDQRDFIITGVFPANIKKGKGYLQQGPIVEGIPPHLLSKTPLVFQNKQPPLQQVPAAMNQRPNGPKISYHPSFSTTLRPVDVEIKPQYVQHISSTAKPYAVYQPQIPPQGIRFSQNFQQYLQEITSLTSPTTTRPVKVRKPNLEFFPPTTSPLKPLGFPHSFQIPEVKPKPISLEGDILVNFKRPRPPVNPEAELINPSLPFGVSPNIKIVDSPDLSRNPDQPYSTKQITFGVAKDFFENLPKSGYFSAPHRNGGNSFVSYNLPGNGGHFYFLTPQILPKGAEEDSRRQDKEFKRVNRSEERSGGRSGGGEPGVHSSQVKHSSEDGYSNHDYLRRGRRKKP